ncbi:hypothetical protein PS838_06142 [Pseudomonas fluorescens]|nr:hypothetical protein PS838_06142 [Pseudomonas fluorescens]
MKPEISFCIVTYNSSKTITSVLESIKLHCQVSHEIVIVDNSSSDDTLEVLNNEIADNIKVIPSSKNLGFGAGNNLAFEHAQANVIALLNSDAFLASPITESHVQMVLSHADVGVLGGVMLSEQHKYRPSFGSFPRSLDFLKLKSIYGKLNNIINISGRNILVVDWVEASFFVMHADTYKKLRGFDESYFMYCEDLDLCYRLRNLNKLSLVDPSLSYIHLGGFSQSRNSWLNSSYLNFIKKHYSGSKKHFSLLFLFLRLLKR